jgi:hypothetical protein
VSDTIQRRLLSPEKRRLYPNARTGTGIQTVGPVTREQRRGLQPGQADDVTWECLKKMGWVEYDGPATTDERGYIVPGSDPNIPPNPFPGKPGVIRPR